MSTSSDLIQHLLDGELDPTLELGLFAELASSAELRNELKQQLAIRSTVQHDRIALVPPAALTNAVFSGLGFAAPLAGAAAGAAGGGLIASWLSKLGLPLITAAAAAGITWVSAQQPSDARVVTGDTQVATRTEEAAAPLTQTAPADNPTLQRGDANLRSAADQRTIAALQRENARLRDALSDAEARVPVQNLEATQMPSTSAVAQDAGTMSTPAVSSIMLTNDVRLTRDNGRQPFGLSPLVETKPTWQSYPFDMFQVRGFSTTPLTNVSVTPQSMWYDNLSVSFVKHLTEHHSLGIEIGNETFAQVFEGNRNGQLIRYEQQPSALWAGIFYRYQTSPISNNFIPFGQVLAGGTKYGPIGRATVGVQYAPAGPLSFLLGLEGAMLAYKFQDTWYTSSKIGLTYGVAVRF